MVLRSFLFKTTLKRGKGSFVHIMLALRRDESEYVPATYNIGFSRYCRRFDVIKNSRRVLRLPFVVYILRNLQSKLSQ